MSHLFGRPSATRAHPRSQGVAAALLCFGLLVNCGSIESRTLKPGDATAGTSAGTGGHGGTHAKGGGGGSSADVSGAGGIGDVAECGDGTRQGSEECDDGNLDSGDGCDGECNIEPSSSPCGNGIIEGGEECDDGNLQPGDGCDELCRKESCGNGRVDAGEQCDPPSSGTCTDHCNPVLRECGNGKVESGEECDDGNSVAGDGCTDCRLDCGDGRIDASAGEDCEPKYSTHCSPTCHWLPTCGDGIVQPLTGEQCDPSNGVNCVQCRLVTPACDGGEGGCGGASGECTPDSDGGPVQNANFDTTSSGWTATFPGLTANVVNDGSPAPMALEVALASSSVRSEAGAEQCVPIRGGTKYELTAHYRVPVDVPDGVGAAVLAQVYSGTQCSGTVLKRFNGPEGRVRDAWTPYSFQIDASDVSDASPLRLLIRLDIVRPANADGCNVRWDSVSLVDPGSHCGDCSIELGEQCDDGNHTSGDGCSADCRIEACGNGIKEPPEECDDGNTTFRPGDTCTPACELPTACDTCSAQQCQSELDACFGLTGAATAGPRAGTARSTLCAQLRTCVRAHSCDLVTRKTEGVTGAYIENCYCGSSGDNCFEPGGDPNGSCRKEIEAALETTNPSLLLDRFDDTNANYPIVGTVKSALACEDSACTECTRAPKCGNGLVEDRDSSFSSTFTFTIDRKAVPCADELTSTGRGCSFEECDDGPNGSADCDKDCFKVACGNYIVQSGEECDDGPKGSDGCTTDCKLAYRCGDDNGKIEGPEECDPPSDPEQQGLRLNCSVDDAKNDPNCACDNKCKLVVCGDGVVQHPWEECDPPNGSTCDSSCHVANQGDCVKCLLSDMTEGALESGYCLNDEDCLAVQHCVIDAGCFNPIPAVCYCGIVDAVACSADAFVPTGPCVTQMLAGAGSLTLGAPGTNLLINQRGFDPGYSTGVAMLILNDAATPDGNAGACYPACFGP